MIKLAYLILAYKHPAQLIRLLAALPDEDAEFFIHIDKKVNPRSFLNLTKTLKNKHIFFIKKRVYVHWGGYSFMKAVLNGLSEILSTRRKFDYLILLSEQDYPIKNNETILDYFNRHNGCEFIEYYSLPYKPWQFDFSVENRLEKYHFFDFFPRGGYRIDPFLKKVLTPLLPKRKIPEGYKLYGGSIWWRLTYECVNFIRDFVNENAKFVSFFKFAFLPEEIFFSTIILNSVFSKNVINNNLTYIDWNTGPQTPKLLTAEDLDNLEISGKLFARKFDITYDYTILDLIDKRILHDIDKTMRAN